jgi:hypothetical protein
MLLLLQNSPLEEGAPMMADLDVIQARKYETREEWQKRTWQNKEEELKQAYTMEDEAIERLQSEWKKELRDEGSDLSEDGWSSEEELLPHQM